MTFVVAVIATMFFKLLAGELYASVWYAAPVKTSRRRGQRHFDLPVSVLSAVFENLRRSLDEMLARATKPEDRRLIMVRMKGTLVQARLGVDDLKSALEETRRKLAVQQRELETVRRRKTLAQGINDTETVAVAERFEAQLDEKVRILAEKVAIQEREVAVGERELDEMKADLRQAMSAGPMGGMSASLDDPLEDASGAKVSEEIDSLARQRARTERDADAERRLEELKKKMGK
jgi:hypothetical protein